MKKMMFGILLVVVSMLFAGCSEEAVSKEDLLKYPQGVQDGKISVTYYDELREYEKKNMRYLTFIIRSENLFEPEKREKVLNHFNEHQKFLEELRFNPKTKEDKKVHDEINKSNILMKEFNSNYIDMIESDGITDEMIKAVDDNTLILQQMTTYRENAIKTLEENGVAGVFSE